MKYTFRLLVCCCLLLAPAEAVACGPVRFFPAPYNPPVVVEKVVEVVKEVFVPAAFFVPTVPVGYAAPAVLPPAPQAVGVAPPSGGAGAAPTPSVCEQRVSELEKKLAQLEARLGAAAPAPANPAGAGPLPAGINQPAGAGKFPVLTAKCLACHGAAPEGNKFSMVQNGVVSLGAVKAFQASGKARRGEMPPAQNSHGIKPLTDEEFAKLADELDTFAR